MSFPQQEIIAKFKGNATLAAALKDKTGNPAVWNGVAPSDLPKPYATIKIDGGKKQFARPSGGGSLVSVQPINVKFTIYCTDQDQAKTLHEAVAAEFEGQSSASIGCYQPISERLYESPVPGVAGESVFISVKEYIATTNA